ncbi:MAG: ABC transporter ATP-binding protein [Maritimibacter sp.]
MTQTKHDTSQPASQPAVGTFRLIQRIWTLVSRRRRRQLVTMCLFLLLGLAMEVVTLAAVIPVVSVLADPAAALKLEVLQPLIVWLKVSDASALRGPIAIIYIGFVLLSAALRLVYLFVSMRLSFAIGSDFAAKAFRHTLSLPYAQQSRLSSSYFIANLQKVNEIVLKGLIPIFATFGAFVLASSISTTLFLVEPTITLVLGASVATILIVLILTFRGPLNRQGRAIAALQNQFMEKLQIARSGIREIILDDAQDQFANDLSSTERALRHHQVRSGFLVSAPRYFLEAIFVVVLIGLAYSLFLGDSKTSAALPTLSLVAVGALKILPATQLMTVNWATFRGAVPSMEDALSLFEHAEPPSATPAQSGPISFENDILLKDVWFRYSEDTPWILKGITLRIKRGETIGVIGQTGAGKSTLIDLIMGLLTPTKGQMLVDEIPMTPASRRVWGKRIAHVPQAIYLTDASVAENIGFGIPADKIDAQRVVAVAQAADIATFVNDGQSGFATSVGERGNRISGGQRQRIGIARALYKKADVIVLDEATSALDGATEERIMDTIHGLPGAPTLLMIAHRLTTLKSCDRIITLENGQIASTQTYQDVIKRHNHDI